MPLTSIKDKLPAKRKSVLGYNGYLRDTFGVGYFDDHMVGEEYTGIPYFFGQGDEFNAASCYQPTHWMELPDVPQEIELHPIFQQIINGFCKPETST